MPQPFISYHSAKQVFCLFVCLFPQVWGEEVEGELTISTQNSLWEQQSSNSAESMRQKEACVTVNQKLPATPVNKILQTREQVGFNHGPFIKNLKAHS
jgi:hypothetical protein